MNTFFQGIYKITRVIQSAGLEIRFSIKYIEIDSLLLLISSLEDNLR